MGLDKHFSLENLDKLLDGTKSYGLVWEQREDGVFDPKNHCFIANDTANDCFSQHHPEKTLNKTELLVKANLYIRALRSALKKAAIDEEYFFDHAIKELLERYGHLDKTVKVKKK
jgi:hypothetical protein